MTEEAGAKSDNGGEDGFTWRRRSARSSVLDWDAAMPPPTPRGRGAPLGRVVTFGMLGLDAILEDVAAAGAGSE